MSWLDTAEVGDDRSNDIHNEERLRSQDVLTKFAKELARGPLNWDRRRDAEFDFLYFCQTYGGEAFHLDWSPNHRRAAKIIEAVTLNGEKFAFAMPRGSGKTTLSRWAVMWAGLYGHSPYSVLIGKTATSGEKMLKSIKTSLRFNDLLFEDFPEAIAPIRHLKGETRKAAGQKFRGEPTMIEWSLSQIVLATIPVDYARCSGAIIDVCGIEGEIRGRQFERPDGRIVRPRLAVVDDPQDRETAKSEIGCDRVVQTIQSDVSYLAGPDAATGVIIPCTVIYENDAADQLLDRKKNPEFQGEKTKLLVSFPTNEKLWEEYRRIREESLEAGNKGREATEFYRENQEAMDAGAEVSWPQRHFPDELSGIQHAMNRYLSDEVSFYAEYQNEPKRTVTSEVVLPDSDSLRRRVNGVGRAIVPNECNKLTAFIDVSENVLWWGLLGFGSGFSTGAAIDYGVFPRQKSDHVTLASVKHTLYDAAADAMDAESVGFEAALTWGLTTLCEQILGREYFNEAGTAFQVDRCLIDTNWHRSTQVVNSFCRRSRFSKILLPSRGRGIVNPDDSLIDPKSKPKPGEWRGPRCKIAPTTDGGRYVLFDANYYKSFLFSRLATPIGDAGSLAFFQAKPHEHKMLVDQLLSETCRKMTIRECELDLWSEVPGRDNHLLDVFVGAIVAAITLGVSLPSTVIPKPKAKRRPRRGGVSYLSA